MELINVVRPVVAVSVFLVFTALALHRHPECRERLLNEPEYAEWFAHEVRRFFPFFPALSALVRKDFEWKGYRLRKGRWTLLDVYGTNHDPLIWGDPEVFRPERFKNRPVDLFGFLPQGGGDAKLTHRCPGERPTIELTKATALLLAGQMTYRVPEQDLSVDMARLPALPKSRFLIRDVQMKPAHGAT